MYMLRLGPVNPLRARVKFTLTSFQRTNKSVLEMLRALVIDERLNDKWSHWMGREVNGCGGEGILFSPLVISESGELTELLWECGPYISQ